VTWGRRGGGSRGKRRKGSWSHIFLLSVQPDHVIPDLGIPDTGRCAIGGFTDTKIYPVIADAHQIPDRIASSQREPLFSIPKYVRYTGWLLTNENTDSTNHQGSPPAIQPDLVIPDRGIPDTALYRTVCDQRFHGHQNLPRHSGRPPNTGPDSIFTAGTHTK
jgi:hypothetical protein